MVVFRAFFKSIEDHIKMTEGIRSASQGDARNPQYFSDFSNQTYQGKDFRGSRGHHSRLVQEAL